MPRVRDSRLARLAAESTRIDSTTGLDYSTPRAWSAVCAFVRAGLVEAGIDPSGATALRLAEAELDMADVSELQGRCGIEEKLAGNEDGLAGVFAAKIGDVLRRFKDGHEPDFGSASIAELFAWCLSRSRSCSR